MDGNAQAPSYVWLNQIGGKVDEGNGLLAIDSKENVYTISVSYTHLDVYKRQVQLSRVGQYCGGC